MVYEESFFFYSASALSVEWETHQIQRQTTWAFVVRRTSRLKNKARAKEKQSCEDLMDKSMILSAVRRFNNASLLWRPEPDIDYEKLFHLTL